MEFENNLTEGPIAKKYVLFIIPIVLSGFLQQLYSTADTMVVGRFAGDTALAAVGATVALTNLILNLFIGLSVGANVVCARYFGAGDKEGLFKTIHTSIMLALISGIFLAFVGFFFSGTFLKLMSTPDDVIGQATIYMQVYFLGAPASLLYNFGAAILRAAGDTKRPLYILAISGVVNVVLNLFCVIVLKLGVVGVAIGTIASQIISAIAVIVILVRTKSEFRLNLFALSIHRRQILKVAATGIPSGINGIMYSLSNVIIQTAINSFGKIAIAGNVVASNIEVFGFLILSSVEQGVVTFVGQNMGAGKLNRVDSVTKVSLCTAFIGAGAFALMMIFWGRFLLGFFADEASREAVVNAAMLKMSVVIYSFILHVPNQVLGGVLKGMGRAVVSMCINIVFVCLLRVVWVFCVYPLNPTLKMIFYSYPVTWGLSSVAAIIAYIFVRRKVFGKEKSKAAS